MGIRDWNGGDWILNGFLTIVGGLVVFVIGGTIYNGCQRRAEQEQEEIQKKDDDKKEEQRLVEEKKELETLVDNKVGTQSMTVTIQDIQNRTIPYQCGEEKYEFPILLIGTTDNTESYVFIKKGFDFIKKGSANIKYKELKDEKISVDHLIKLLKGQECSYDNNDVINAKGIVEKISYDL